VLELVQRSGEPQYDRVRYQVGYAVADIESARGPLVSRGVRQVTEIEGDAQAGGRWCYFRDAEGNIFEIKERRGQRTQ
jgi:predicted enzyme related to lactoylglutathione lyase